MLQTDPRLPLQGDRRLTDWGRLYALQASLGGALALVSDTGLQAYRSTVDLQAEAGDYEPAVEYPESPLAQGLQTCAQLIASNLGTGVCYVTTRRLRLARPPERPRTPSCSTPSTARSARSRPTSRRKASRTASRY